MRIGVYRFRNCKELGDVESALPEFEFRHERLPLPKAFPKLYLCYARILSSLHQQLDYPSVKIGAK